MALVLFTNLRPHDLLVSDGRIVTPEEAGDVPDEVVDCGGLPWAASGCACTWGPATARACRCTPGASTGSPRSASGDWRTPSASSGTSTVHTTAAMRTRAQAYFDRMKAAYSGRDHSRRPPADLFPPSFATAP